MIPSSHRLLDKHLRIRYNTDNHLSLHHHDPLTLFRKEVIMTEETHGHGHTSHAHTTKKEKKEKKEEPVQRQKGSSRQKKHTLLLKEKA